MKDPFPGSSADFYEQIQVLKADLERLKTINSSRTFLYLEARSLITELADALESIPIVLHPPPRKLLQRAREATQGTPTPEPAARVARTTKAFFDYLE